MSHTEPLFGFGLQQKKSLMEYLAENAGAATAADVTVAAGTDGLAAGSVQAALQALASRIEALENP